MSTSPVDIIVAANTYFAAAGFTSTRIDRAQPHPTLPNAYLVHAPGYSGVAGRAAVESIMPELSSEYNNILLRDGDKWSMRYVA